MNPLSKPATDAERARWVTIWDPFVRFFHWTLLLAFVIAYLTEDDLLTLHVWAGYVVGGLVVLRVLWGFVGPKHARFSDFVFSPGKVRAYALDLLRFRATRYLGHSPAGGAMVMVLLVGLVATVWTGLEVYAVEENAGPLAAATVVRPETASQPLRPQVRLVNDEHDDDERNGKKKNKNKDGFWEEAHEVLANLMLFLILLHVGGVMLTSLAHRENLIRAMITGRKRAG